MIKSEVYRQNRSVRVGFVARTSHYPELVRVGGERERTTFAAEMTCLPRPFPSEAPSMIPGKSRIWISAPPYSRTPGMAVRVVKE